MLLEMSTSTIQSMICWRMMALATQAKLPTLGQAGKSSSSSSSVSYCMVSSFFYLHLHLHGFLTMFLLVLVLDFASVTSVILLFHFHFYFQDFLASMTKMMSLEKLSMKAWRQSLLPYLEDDFPGDLLDGRLVGGVLGLPGQH